MNNTLTFSSLLFAPTVPIGGLFILFLIGLVAILMRPSSAKIKGLYFLTLLGFMALMLNPQKILSQTEPIPRTLILLVDRSHSNTLDDRRAKTDAALAYLKDQLTKYPWITPLIVDVSTTSEGETRIMDRLNESLSFIPENQRAGVILITDGVSHDWPMAPILRDTYGPLHVLLTGSKKDEDTRLSLTEAPGYGLTGKTIRIKIKLDHEGPARQTQWPITIRSGDKTISQATITSGKEATFDLPITKPGENLFLAETPIETGDLAPRNNQIPIVIQGVRDRLKVLLVSAEPYIGGRMWRNMLTADAGIDLVHFTILRKPDSIDPTPSSQMALIPFPFEELFETRISQFDLVILDRYRADNLMPNRYLDNIAAYVKEGGGLLEVSGIDYAGENSIANTKLKDILPISPDGQIIRRAFIPHITPEGLIHPVTSGIKSTSLEKAQWGPWTLQISGSSTPGAQVLMSGVDGRPLLSLARVEKGRVAQLSSDQIWLWARGYEGGGPYQELLRPLIHWLLKEPELEEEALKVQIHGDRAHIERRTLQPHLNSATLISPDNTKTEISFTMKDPGVYETTIPLTTPGIYQVTSAGLTYTFSSNDTPPPEYQRVIPNPPELNRIISHPTGGAFIQLEDMPHPELRPITLNKIGYAGGKTWIGVPKTSATRITGSDQAPLFPPWVWMSVVGGLLCLSWGLDGRSRPN